MAKMKYVALILLLIAATALTACYDEGTETPTVAPTTKAASGDASATATKPSQKNIMGIVQLWHSWDDTGDQALQDIIALFQKDYPNVQFKITRVSADEMASKFENSAASGPTVIIAPASSAEAANNAGAIWDVSPLMATEPDLLASIPEALYAACQGDGDVVYGLPITAENGATTEIAYLGSGATYYVKTAGWEFIKFLLSPAAQEILVAAGHSTVIN